MVMGKSKRDENAEATRNVLIHKAGALFGKNGFNNTSLGRIAEDANLTKGAIYHHFSNKEDIFAVCYSLQASQVAELVRQVPLTDDAWQDTVNLCHAYLDTAFVKKGSGISIQEAITVLGWNQWRALDKEHTMSLLVQSIKRLQDEGLLKPYTDSLLADTIYGILVHAMMNLVDAKDKKATREELLQLLQDFILGVMIKPTNAMAN